MHFSENSLVKFSLVILILFSNSILAQNPVRDTTFGNNGNVRTPIGPNNEDAISVVVQGDDKIIAGGTQTDNPTFGPQNFSLVRYQTNGDLDSSFGVNGIVISSFASQNFLNVIKLQSDGKILAAGQCYTDFCIARYNIDGSVDSAFGDSGVAMIPTTTSSGVYDLFILPNGNIVAAGANAIPNSNYEMKMVRLTSDGILDSTFGSNGVVHDTLVFSSTLVSSVLVQNDDKIILGGRGQVNVGGNTVYQMYLARFFETGMIDSTYGVNGVASYPLALNVNDMSFDANGKIVAVGEIGTNQLGTSGDISVMRFLLDGAPDSTFGTDASSVISVDSYADYANALLLQSDGKILVGGSYFNFGGGSVTDCLVIRFLDNGTPDSTFGDDGVFKTGVSGGTDRILDMAMDSQNRIVVSGAANSSVNFDFIVGRIRMDLSTTGIDPFISGISINDFRLYPNPARETLIINSSEKIIEAGIFNLAGQHYNLNTNYPTGDFSIDISNLDSGIYFLRIVTDTGMRVKKFSVID